MGSKVIQNSNENISKIVYQISKKSVQKAWKTSKEGFKNGKCLLQNANRICSIKSALEKSQERNGKG